MNEIKKKKLILIFKASHLNKTNKQSNQIYSVIDTKTGKNLF